ncbi:UNVERIFIED_CONTAM: hypothetical protein K2H54_051666 [Gekko kuhli]
MSLKQFPAPLEQTVSLGHRFKGTRWDAGIEPQLPAQKDCGDLFPIPASVTFRGEMFLQPKPITEGCPDSTHSFGICLKGTEYKYLAHTHLGCLCNTVPCIRENYLGHPQSLSGGGGLYSYNET